ncbi:unnamed protein product [Boreogadus saida]
MNLLQSEPGTYSPLLGDRKAVWRAGTGGGLEAEGAGGAQTASVLSRTAEQAEPRTRRKDILNRRGRTLDCRSGIVDLETTQRSKGSSETRCSRAPDPGLDPDLPHGETDRRSRCVAVFVGQQRERCVDHRTKQRCNLARRCSVFVSPPPCLL